MGLAYQEHDVVVAFEDFVAGPDRAVSDVSVAVHIQTADEMQATDPIQDENEARDETEKIFGL